MRTRYFPALIAALTTVLAIAPALAQSGAPVLPERASQSAVAAQGARCDGASDDTGAIVAAGKAAKTLLVVPAGCRFDRKRLLRDLPPDALILDLSVINGFASPGETTKSVGILARDAAVNDTQWLIGSGHHAVLNLNNFGIAGSESGNARRASVLWSAGDFANGSLKTGFRGAGLMQFGQEPGRREWSLTLRSLAPWPAIAAGYEMWAGNERIAGAGVYRSTGEAMLVSTSRGTTGSAAPLAAYGQTVRDGSVTWRYADSPDRSIMRISEQGRVLFGLGDFSASFRHAVSPFHPANNVSEWVASGPSKDVLVRLVPTDASAAEAASPALRATAGQGLSIVDGRDNATPIARFDAARGMETAHVSVRGEMARIANGAIDVAGKGLLFVQSRARQVVESLTGGNDGQVVTLHFLDGNTALANGNGRDRMHLGASRPFAGTTDSVIVLRRLPTDLGGRWVETGRSEK